MQGGFEINEGIGCCAAALDFNGDIGEGDSFGRLVEIANGCIVDIQFAESGFA